MDEYTESVAHLRGIAHAVRDAAGKPDVEVCGCLLIHFVAFESGRHGFALPGPALAAVAGIAQTPENLCHCHCWSPSRVADALDKLADGLEPLGVPHGDN